ncbi:phage holin family protein [Umezawaea beigongshangensis]|uniref:phage holin family protein n=1 Tax=Umezawaea beigongshangensis TaxID=2780383 RepID=UPI0018F1DFEA|nr:phage holin family protein [Umezawaea beigongshangensis]
MSHVTTDRDVSTGQLVSQLTEQVSRLAREEIKLAVSEVQTKGKRVGVGAGLFGGAGVLAWFGGMSLVAGIVLLLATVLEPWAAAFVVAAVIFVLAGILALLGKKQVQKGSPPVPEQAIDGVKRDIATVKEGAHR